MNDKKPSLAIVAARLHLARMNAGLSQDQAAKLLGLSAQILSQIENGIRNIDVKELKQFSEIYRVKLEWLNGTQAPIHPLIIARLNYLAKNLDEGDRERIIDLINSMR